jgi:hypothetical protein
VANQTVVPNPPSPPGGPPNRVAHNNEPVDPEQNQAGTPQPGSLVPGSMAAKRRHLQNQGLSRKVAKTMLAARRKSTYKKYESCWNHYAGWCGQNGIDPYTSSVQEILEYLQYCLSNEGLATESVRGRIYAIALFHTKYPLKSLTCHPWFVQFNKGMKTKYYVPKNRLPKWRLKWVLQALRRKPFEPLDPRRIDLLSYKTAFLLAITSAKRIGELQALSSNPRYLEITPGGIRLRLNPSFVPKVNKPQNREQELHFTPFCPRTNPNDAQTYYRLCVRRAVKHYINQTAPFRQDEQLFVCFSGPRKGRAAAKATIAAWVKKAITLAYQALRKPLPTGIKAHQTRGIAASWAQFHNTSLRDICDTASWGDMSTFAKHYQLNLADNVPTARFANAVLQTVMDDRPQ